MFTLRVWKKDVITFYFHYIFCWIVDKIDCWTIIMYTSYHVVKNSCCQGFLLSRLHVFKISRFQEFMLSRLHVVKISRFQDFILSRLQYFLKPIYQSLKTSINLSGFIVDNKVVKQFF